MQADNQLSWQVIQGDCLEVMRGMAENSVDSIVCDPPYEYGFMGRAWDKQGVAFRVETWREALRVAKPGAIMLAFGGRRTEHRLVCAIEDAGWQIIDKIAWCFGSGFPKSYSVSKALTNLIPASLQCACAHHSNYTGLSSRAGYRRECDSHDALLPLAQDNGLASAPSPTDAHERNRDDHNGDGQDARRECNPDRSPIAPLSIGDCVRLLGRMSEDSQSDGNRLSDTLESMLRAGLSESRKMALRTLGTDDLACDSVLTLPYSDAPMSSISGIYHKCAECQNYLAVTGYGTALKPAIEEICVAMKPVENGYAANMLKWGVAGINVDGCRIGAADGHGGGRKASSGFVNGYEHDGFVPSSAGRWPANLILSYPEDEYALRDDVTPDQLRQLAGWFDANR